MSLKYRYILITILVVLTIVSATSVQIWVDRRETRQREELTAVDITKIVEAHVVSTVGQAQSILGLIADIIIADNDPQMMRESGRWKRLNAYCMSVNGCKSIAVVNPSGRVVALSDTPGVPTIDASDRLYFKVPQQTRKLYIGPGVVSRIKGNPIVFSIALPVFDSAGNLLAVVSAGIDTNHITDFYGLMGFGVSPTVSIFKGDGDLVARYPDMAKHVGKNNAKGPLFAIQLPKAPQGVYESVSVLDGKKRIAAYRSLNDLDLVVFSGIEKSAAYHSWKDRSVRTVSIVTLVLALIVFILVIGYRSIARQVKLETANRELNELATIDGLTGIANRRLFDTTLRREWSRFSRDKQPLSLLLLDVDFFKPYNDHYGHQAGDECLRKIAQALNSSLHREMDLVARFGGEEFAAILNCDSQGAQIVAERMRAAVESLDIRHDFSECGNVVTISIGLASTSTSNVTSLEGMIRAADAALYEAKSHGRNTISSKFTGRAEFSTSA